MTVRGVSPRFGAPDRYGDRAQLAASAGRLSDEQRQRIAAAFRNKPPPSRRERPPPTERADSSDPCRWCGVSGLRGCDHFLPYARPKAGDLALPSHGPKMNNRAAFNLNGAASRALLRDIEAFLELTGLPAWRFGQEVGDSALVRRLRDGKNVRPATAERVREFIARYEG